MKSVQSYQLKHFIVNFELISHLFYHGQNIVDNFTKLSKMVFLWNVLHQIFCSFLAQLSKFGFWVPGWGLPFSSKLFGVFIEVS